MVCNYKGRNLYELAMHVIAIGMGNFNTTNL